MATTWKAPTWRMPNEKNQSKFESYSLDFDGSEFINCGNLTFLNGISAFSTSAWFKCTGVATGIILNGYQSLTEKFWVQLLNSTTIRYVSSFNVKDVTVSNIEDGNWHNIVTVHNGTSLDIYIDGIKQNSSPLTITAPTGDIGNNFLLGRLSYASANYFNGKLSNISIFNEALTSTEVLKLYANGVPQDLTNFTPAPVAWWTLGSNSFFNGTNYICRDLIGSNDGTSANAGVDAIVGDAPRSEANGVGSNNSIPENLEGSTKYSSNNSWSINMSSEARVTDVP